MKNKTNNRKGETMKTVVAIRDGNVKLRISAEERNGVLRAGKNILINSDLVAQSDRSQEWVVTQIKADKITPEIEAMGMRIGDNGNGLICRWADDFAAEERARAKAEYNALPSEVRACREERIAIDRLFDAAEKSLNHDTDDCNVTRGYQQKGEANARLKTWKAKYQDAARLEQAQSLRDHAARQDDLASGALIYDCDGWLNQNEQQKRHDEFKSEAAKLRAEALKLEQMAK